MRYDTKIYFYYLPLGHISFRSPVRAREKDHEGTNPFPPPHLSMAK
jgi:hypothetical protein